VFTPITSLLCRRSTSNSSWTRMVRPLSSSSDMLQRSLTCLSLLVRSFSRQRMGVAVGEWNLVLLSSGHHLGLEPIPRRYPLRSDRVSSILLFSVSSPSDRAFYHLPSISVSLIENVWRKRGSRVSLFSILSVRRPALSDFPSLRFR